jgi:hypothetical protein
VLDATSVVEKYLIFLLTPVSIGRIIQLLVAVRTHACYQFDAAS